MVPDPSRKINNFCQVIPLTIMDITSRVQGSAVAMFDGEFRSEPALQRRAGERGLSEQEDMRHCAPSMPRRSGTLRQGHREGGSLSLAALYGNLPAVPLHDLLHD